MIQTADVHGAYQRVLVATADPRSIEAEAFARVNRDLVRAQKYLDSDFPSFVKAVSRNLQLWTLITSDLAGDGNQLPDGLKAQLWKVSSFVRRHSMAILCNSVPAEVGVLTEINANMIYGLKTSVEPKETA